MTPSKKYKVKSYLFSKSRRLVVDPAYLELEGFRGRSIRFSKENIEGFRFGVDRVYFNIFHFSTTYQLDVRDYGGQVAKIRLHTSFGIRQRATHQRFLLILRAIQQAYFNDMAYHYAVLVRGGLSFALAGVLISPEGIKLQETGPVIAWKCCGLKQYFNSCSIYDTSDGGQYRVFSYQRDWNANILRLVVEYVMQERDRMLIV